MNDAGGNRNGEKANKIKSNPCSKIFELLEACAIRKGVARNNEKDRMQACPSETDVLIKCIHKNPLFFQAK